jgi:hypothetical protein
MSVGSLALFKILANNQKINIGRKRTNTKGSILLKNLQTTKEQTQEEEKNT